MVEKLTDKSVKALPAPPKSNRVFYDTDVKGFGCRVTATGARAFVLNYRRKADGLERRWTIGGFPDWTTGAAREEAKRLKRLIDGGADPVGEQQEARGAPTVSDLCDRFLAEFSSTLRPSTAGDYAALVRMHIKPALGRQKVAAVRYAEIAALHRRMSGQGTGHQANRAVALLSRMFNLAIRWQWRTDNPARGIERNQEPARHRYLSAAELVSLSVSLAEHPDQQAANIFRLLLLTGARRSEVAGIRWADLDLAEGVWTKPAATTKQKAMHRVPLSAPARQLLADLHAARSDDTEYVFPGRGNGARYEIKNAWRVIRKRAGLPDVRIHDLRHSFASVLVSAGFSLPVIGALLGHARPETTARYAHLADDPLRIATERASAIIAGKPSADVVLLGALK
jgi:integrase